MTKIKSLAKIIINNLRNYLGLNDSEKISSDFKNFCNQFEIQIEEAIITYNEKISAYNKDIEFLNTYRENDIRSKIDVLGKFLNKFGNLPQNINFCEENKKELHKLHKETFVKIKELIDLATPKKIFFYYSLLDIIITKIFIQTTNIELKMVYEKFKLSAKEALRIEKNEEKYCELEIEILRMYIKTLQDISKSIERDIIPELSLVEAFFEAKYINNLVITGEIVKTEINFPEKYNLLAIKDTKYCKYYTFVKNVYLFMILVVEIYSSTILSRLFERNTQEEIEDITKDQLKEKREDKKLLLKQRKMIRDIVIKIGKSKNG